MPAAGCATAPVPAASATPTPPVATSTPAALPTYAGTESLGAAMEGWAYPYPVQTLQFELDGRLLHMAYMDVAPAQPNGQTVVLLHGKNFGGDYWAGTIDALSARGYRVMADNTLRLLDHLKLPRLAVVANSMGGMLGVHPARCNPERVSALVLENPLGLEDYVVSIPPQQSPNLLKLEMAQTPANRTASSSAAVLRRPSRLLKYLCRTHVVQAAAGTI